MSGTRKSDVSFLYAVAAVCVLISFVAPLIWNVWRCSRVETLTGRETRFDIGGGCFVKTSNGFVPLANWREIE